MNKKPTILVTGALGHIGSALIRILPMQVECKKIILIDNLATFRYASLFNLPRQINYEFKQYDIRNDLNSIINDSVDYVIHLAALTEPQRSQEKPEEFISYNESCTRNILDFCIKKTAKLIALSSTSVYSKSGNSLNEDVDSSFLNGQTPYARCKLMEEKMICEISPSSNQTIILRFGTIYGSSIGMRFHTAVNKFCWEAVFNNEIPVWETALNQFRPYLDLEDAIQAIIHSVLQDDIKGGIYNVATNNSTVNDIVSIIKDIKPSVKIRLVKSAVMNNLSYSVSSGKICATGYKLNGSLKKSIEKTIQLLGGL